MKEHEISTCNVEYMKLRGSFKGEKEEQILSHMSWNNDGIIAQIMKLLTRKIKVY